MSRKILLQLVVIMLLLVPSFVLAQTGESKDYTVKKGDTLWSISRQELGNSFLWPKVWKENPEISNPDRLYPGQTVKIPIYLKQKVEERRETTTAGPAVKEMPANKVKKTEKEAAERQEPVKIPLEPLVNDNLLEASGYISDTVPSLGIVDGSASGRRLFGNDDTVFVKTGRPVEAGERFFVIKVVELGEPGATRSHGYIIEPVGVVEIKNIEGADTQARIIKAFGPIYSGDRLDTYCEVRSPLTTGEFRKPDINGEVIAARNLQLLNALYDIVYLDKGVKDGIEIGDMFRTINTASGHRIPTGTIQIIGVRDTTSTAVIRGNMLEAISAGNLFVQLR